MKKRNKIITMILSMSMVLTMMIGSLTIVNAAGTQSAAEAFTADVAEHTGNTYKLKKNLDLNGTSIFLVQDEEITIDLNGYTIENTGNVIGSMSSATNIKLTIMDSSSDKTGKIISSKNSSISLTAKNNNITIKGGSIISHTSSSLSIGDLYGGTLTIEDGIFYGPITGKPLGYTGSKIQISGGYFEPNKLDGYSFIISSGSDKTVKSYFKADSYVSLKGATPIPVSSASEFDGKTYAGTVQVFASGPTADTTKDTTVKALVNKQITPPDVNVPTYTTTIPETIDLGTLNMSETDNLKSVPFNITVGDAKDFGNGEVVVSIKADQDLNLTSGNNKLPYTIHNAETGGESILSGQTLFTFNGNETKTGRIQVNENGIPAAGSYTGTLTFNIAYHQSGTN